MKIKKLTCFLLAALMILAMAGCRNRIPQVKDFADDYVDALPENAEDGLTLHAFNWTYREIMINLENIRKVLLGKNQRMSAGRRRRVQNDPELVILVNGICRNDAICQ